MTESSRWKLQTQLKDSKMNVLEGVELNPRAQTGLDLMNAAHVWAHLDRNWAVYEGDKSKT